MLSFSCDAGSLLAVFTCDYIEHTLDPSERFVFEEYIATDSALASFIQKSKKGKKALNKAYSVEAAADFEEKLAKRIEQEIKGNDQSEEHCMPI